MPASSEVEATLAGREAVLGELRNADRLIVVAHEHPDGDALGSLVAMQALLGALGKDTPAFHRRG